MGVGDLTEIPTDAAEGAEALYLASILDLNSRRAVGYALGATTTPSWPAAAVQVAIAVRGGDVAGRGAAHRLCRVLRYAEDRRDRLCWQGCLTESSA